MPPPPAVTDHGCKSPWGIHEMDGRRDSVASDASGPLPVALAAVPRARAAADASVRGLGRSHGFQFMDGLRLRMPPTAGFWQWTEKPVVLEGRHPESGTGGNNGDAKCGEDAGAPIVRGSGEAT